MRTEICVMCDDEFELGYGVWDERRQNYYCDVCAGIERDENGYAGIPFNLINDELRSLGVRLIPHKKYEYELIFTNNPSADLINNAKRIVSYYQMSEWFDDEMREADEW